MQNYSENTSTLAAFSSTSSVDGGNYWNIDDILAEEELIPCQFKSTQNHLGFLQNAQKNRGKKMKDDQGAL